MKDNLPIYLMHTMKRMRTNEDFYPELNILELYKLVTRKTYSLQQLNPQLLLLVGGEDTSSEQVRKEQHLHRNNHIMNITWIM